MTGSRAAHCASIRSDNIPRVNGSDPTKPLPVASPVPRGGYLAIGLILLAMALLSVYSNVQKGRRDQIEKVTITRAADVTPLPGNSPSPSAEP